MRPLPQLTPVNAWFWQSGEDGKLRIQGCADCGALVHPPTPICPVCRSRERVHDDRLRTRNGGRLHRQPTSVVAGIRPAVRDRERRARRGPERPPHHEHRRLRRSLRRARRPARRRSASNITTTCGCRCSSRPARPTPRTTVGEPRRPPPRAPLGPERFEHRAVLSGIGRSAIGRRLMVDPLSLTVDACLAAVADAGLTLDDIDGLSTYPGHCRHGHERGRRHRGRRGAALASDMDQRRRRAPRSGRFGDRGDARGRERAVPSRPVLPHGVGVDVRRARHARCRGRRPRRWVPGVARALRRAVCRELDRHEREPVLPPLRGDARDARLDRGQRTAGSSAQPGGDLPRSDDDGRLHDRPSDHDAVRACTTATSRATLRSLWSCRMRRSRPICRSVRYASKRSVRRSPSASRGTRTRSRTSRRCSASRPICGPAPT